MSEPGESKYDFLGSQADDIEVELLLVLSYSQG